MLKLKVVFFLSILVGISAHKLDALFYKFESLKNLDLSKILLSINDKSFLQNVSSNCKRDFLAYVKGVEKGEIWALTMLDSMEKFPSGLFEGRRVIIGHYLECIGVAQINFTGQHCMMDFEAKRNLSSKSETVWPGRGVGLVLANQFSFGLCVPSTCKSEDLKIMLLSLDMHKSINFEINDKSCTVGHYEKFRAEDWIAVCCMLAIVVFCLIGTIYDLKLQTRDKTTYKKSLWENFSLYANYKYLSNVNPSTSELGALNGIRFLSIAWVVLGHTVSHLFSCPLNNYREAIQSLDRTEGVIMFNGYPSVDSFFFLSGLLVCCTFFKDISVKGSFDAPVAFIKRYLRLTPPLVIMVLIHVSVFSRLGRGPLWKMEAEKMESLCRSRWWIELLYIKNYYHMNDQESCIRQSWYLCSDMQMFLLSPFILYVMLLYPTFAPAYLIFLTVVASLISFVVSYEGDLPPNLTLKIFSTGSISKRELMSSKEYQYFHTRMVPWILGIATGYIMCGIRSKKINFNWPKIWIVVGWVISLTLCVSSLYGIMAFSPIGSYHSTLKRSSYRAFHRVGWALGLSWIIIACVNGYGGPINSILSLDIFQPLAKLSYSTFLIHKSVQQYRYFRSKDVKNYSNFDFVYSYVGDLIISIILSIPFTLFFEMPFIQLAKHLVQNLQILPFPTKLKYKENIVMKKPDSYHSEIKSET